MTILIVRWRTLFLIAGILLLGPFVQLHASKATPHGWIRFLVDADQLKGRPGVPFAIASVNYSDYRLFATAWFRYVQGRDPIILHGSQDPDGLFRPSVVYEVAIKDKAEWRKISERKGGESTAVVGPEHPILRLSVDMDPFRSCVGVYRYGRILLENGDVAVIELEDLLPTADARGDADGSFRESVSGGDMRMRQQGVEEPAPDGFAHLSSVTSLGGRLIGDFVLINRSGKTLKISGTRTLDGDFWPKVELLAGRSLQDWKTIGKSQNNGTSASIEIATGKAEIVRVMLSDYKPLIGERKYGKIIFPSGRYGVFYLELLDPQS